MRKFNIIQRWIGVLALGAMFFTVSCNKEFENLLPESALNDSLSLGDGKKKVLLIIMDGVKGNVLESVDAKNIKNITRRAIYSYDGIADYQRNVLTQAAAWTTMLSGVDYTKHHVESEDFSGWDEEATPTVFSQLDKENPNLRTVSFASQAVFNEHLAKDAKVAENLDSDADVVEAVIDELETESPSLLVAQLHGAELAAQDNYSESNTEYVEALLQIDDYIGDILKALESRKSYSKENWMVVIASSKGGGVSGGDPDSDIYQDGSRNTFVAFYNPKFRSDKYTKLDMDALPFEGVSPKFTGAGSHAAQTDLNIANFGADQEATVRFNVRWDQGSTIYPSFFTKRDRFAAGVVGWTLFVEYETIGINFSQAGQGNTQRLHTRKVADGKWHNIAIRFQNEGGRRYVTLFVDGVPAPGGRLDITNVGNLNTSSPLRLGSIGDANVNCIINEVAIYDVALPDDAIVSSSVLTPLTEVNDPYYSEMIGYWRGVENSGSEVHDALGLSAPFSMLGNSNWSSFSDVSPNIKPTVATEAFKAVPNSVDIATMIYNWLNISVPKDWDLMGEFYNPTINLPKD